MKPVYQTIFGNKNGNCLQAVVGSVLELPLDEVPHFISFGKDWFKTYYEFLSDKGFGFRGILNNPRDIGSRGDFDFVAHLNEISEGFGGFYIATVYSPNHCDLNVLKVGDNPATHAVVVDSGLSIVHDPNPEYKGVKYPLADILEHNGIISVDIINVIV